MVKCKATLRMAIQEVKLISMSKGISRRSYDTWYGTILEPRSILQVDSQTVDDPLILREKYALPVVNVHSPRIAFGLFLACGFAVVGVGILDLVDDCLVVHDELRVGGYTFAGRLKQEGTFFSDIRLV